MSWDAVIIKDSAALMQDPGLRWPNLESFQFGVRKCWAFIYPSQPPGEGVWLWERCFYSAYGVILGVLSCKISVSKSVGNWSNKDFGPDVGELEDAMWFLEKLPPWVTWIPFIYVLEDAPSGLWWLLPQSQLKRGRIVGPGAPTTACRKVTNTLVISLFY